MLHISPEINQGIKTSTPLNLLSLFTLCISASLIYTDDYKAAVAADGKPIWSKVHANSFSSLHESTISPMRLFKDKVTMKPAGMVVINTDPAIFASSIKDAKIGKTGYMLISDKDGSTIANNELSHNFNDMTEKLKQMLSITASLSKETTNSAAQILNLSNSINDSSKMILLVVSRLFRKKILQQQKR